MSKHSDRKNVPKLLHCQVPCVMTRADKKTAEGSDPCGIRLSGPALIGERNAAQFARFGVVHIHIAVKQRLNGKPHGVDAGDSQLYTVCLESSTIFGADFEGKENPITFNHLAVVARKIRAPVADNFLFLHN